jgi:hypothetical protein
MFINLSIYLQLMIWWDSLSMIEKRVASNKEELVLVTEAAIQGQVAIFSQTNRDRSSQDDDNDKSQ